MKCVPWTEPELELLKAHYSESLQRDIVALLPNRTAGAIRERARTMGLRKSDACRKKMSDIRSASTTRKERLEQLRQSERRKWRLDIPQRTRWHFSAQTEAKYAYRYYMRKCGYIECANQKNVLYYTNDMARHTKAEAGAARYGIRVLEIPAENNVGATKKSGL